jgi:hypothetical protein
MDFLEKLAVFYFVKVVSWPSLDGLILASGVETLYCLFPAMLG